MKMSLKKLQEARNNLLYARQLSNNMDWGGRRKPVGSIRNEEDAARGREIRAQREKEHRENEIKRKAEDFDKHLGFTKQRKVNVHDRLTGKAPIAVVTTKKV